MRSGRSRGAINSYKYEVDMARSKKSKIAIVSAFTLFTSFFSNVMKLVKELGGNEAMVYDFFSSPHGTEEVSKLIISKLERKIEKAIQSLSDLITSLKLDWVNDNITESNFPVLPEDEIQSEKEYKLFHFGRLISSKSAIAEMEKEDFRPATTRELLSWAFKNWDGKIIVVALGQIWRDSDGNRSVSVLHFDGDKRKLNLYWFDDDWGDRYHFFGVRK